MNKYGKVIIIGATQMTAKYDIYDINGNELKKITKQPMSLRDIRKIVNSVRRLEASGYRLVRAA